MKGDCDPGSILIPASAMEIDVTARLIEDEKFKTAEGANGVFPGDAGQPGHQAATRTTVRPF